ncbi:hypothetical protein A8135_13365 [Legionella jamestowniensis]|uniref:Acyl-CoA thioesterase n=1 Tax=Legionella jamestowniensis TaxID=455 RepID=A0ABX2XV85_9GAMM|nr:thioesterase family protein [Legionella jamestowniensis]OCH98141.1 hypothetical protein A8135_13365 [Legionella jamestowniensis]
MINFIWESKVRAHEIDAQGIVNNSHYLCYFDHVRTLHLHALGADWIQLSNKGINLVLSQANLQYLKPLRAFERFKVTSTIAKEGRLKLIFTQSLYNSAGALMCRGINTVVCVDINRNKPIAIDKVEALKNAFAE